MVQAQRVVTDCKSRENMMDHYRDKVRGLLIQSTIWSGCLLAPVAMLTGCEHNDAGAVSVGQAPLPQVGVVTLATERVELSTALPGRTTAFRVAEIRPQVSGIILKRLFEEGAEVQAGQQLYQIDPAQYQAAYDNAAAAQARSEAVLASAKLTVDRYKHLELGRDISKQDFDNANAAELQAEADVLAAKSAVQTAHINLEYTKVYSPIAGRTGRSSVTEGALVTANQPTSLVTIQQLDQIYVDVTQSSVQMLKLQRNLTKKPDSASHQAAVSLVLEDDTAYPQLGSLQFTEVTVDQSTGSVTLRALFPNPERQLLPGMFVHANVKESVNEQALLVPQSGILRNSRGEPYMLIVSSENKVELHPVKVDRAVGDKWLLTEGGHVGDRVIVDGFQKIRPGATVSAVTANSTGNGQNTLR